MRPEEAHSAGNVNAATLRTVCTLDPARSEKAPGALLDAIQRVEGAELRHDEGFLANCLKLHQ